MSAAEPTVVDVLRRRAERAPERQLYGFLTDGETEDVRLTYGQLHARASGIAGLLVDACAPGDRVLLLLPQGDGFAAGFWGCLYAGLPAVPAALPHPALMKRALPRLRAICADARPAVGLVAREQLATLETMFEAAPELRKVRWLAVEDAAADGRALPAVKGSQAAFIQYTSGSTDSPKGVVVTQANLAANSRMILDAFAHTEAMVVVSWLPMTHDMALIGSVVQPAFAGGRCHFMSPLSFLQRPARWLEAVGKHRATSSGGPNFAFGLAVEKTTPEERAALDLSSWDLAYCGSEPVHRATLESFSAAFAPCGFDPKALYPCYGLAEATLIVTGGKKGAGASFLRVSRAALARGKVAPCDAGPDAVDLADCGRARLEGEVVVVNRRREPAAEGSVGEIWVKGPHLAAGYWDAAAPTKAAFGATLASGDGPYLRTGDLGFLDGGRLFVTGRLKDLIIIRGLNHHPEDIERTAQSSHPAIRQGGCAAFSVDGPDGERLVVAAELKRPGAAKPEEIQAAVRSQVALHHQLQAHEVVVVRSGALFKTTSGKIQRRACREAFLAGELRLAGS